MKLSKVKFVAVPVATMAITGATLLGAGTVSAASTHTTHSSRATTKREAKYEARLERAVAEGKLTSAQEQAILAEQTILKTELKNTPKSSRKAKRASLRAEAKAWAKQHDVSARWLIQHKA